jgi:hypothetical protein
MGAAHAVRGLERGGTSDLLPPLKMSHSALQHKSQSKFCIAQYFINQVIQFVFLGRDAAKRFPCFTVF